MRRTFWATAALMSLAFGPTTIGLGDARAQWVEVSTVRYGLLGRPRSVETHWVPAVGVVPNGPVLSASSITGVPVVSMGYARIVPTASAIPTSFVSEVPAAIPTTTVATSYPVFTTGYVSTGYVSAAPVVRAYSPAVRVLETRAIYFP